MMKHLDSYSRLTDQQFGFREKRSTALQVFQVLDHWSELLVESKQLDVIYFSQAFDTVPQQRLIEQLEAYCIQGKMLDWVTDFLSRQKQRVSVTESFIWWLDVYSGILQGGVLWPVLFILYVHDLPDVLPDVLTHYCMMFADDTKVHMQVNNDAESDELQQDLCNLVNWTDTWQLQFNVG